MRLIDGWIFNSQIIFGVSKPSLSFSNFSKIKKMFLPKNIALKNEYVVAQFYSIYS